jgi:hypothetical protein
METIFRNLPRRRTERIATRIGVVTETVARAASRICSVVNHPLYCAGKTVRAEVIDRVDGGLSSLSGVVNSKSFNLFLAAMLAVLIIGYSLPSRGFGERQQVAYISVPVAAGDTVWMIAARQVNATDDIREMIFAIRQANNLNNNAEIFPGQVLKVPITGPVDDKSRTTR